MQLYSPIREQNMQQTSVMHLLLYDTDTKCVDVQDSCYPAVPYNYIHFLLVFVFILIGSPFLSLLKMLNDAFPVIGVPKSAVPECQCLWCAWVLWEVQWTWGECKVPTSSIFSVKLCTVDCKAVKQSCEDSAFIHLFTFWPIEDNKVCFTAIAEQQCIYSAAFWVMAAAPILYHQSSLSHWG